MLLQKKNGYLNLCYMGVITDEQSVVYIKYNTYPQNFHTTSFYIGFLYRGHRHVMENETVSDRIATA